MDIMPNNPLQEGYLACPKLWMLLLSFTGGVEHEYCLKNFTPLNLTGMGFFPLCELT